MRRGESKTLTEDEMASAAIIRTDIRADPITATGMHIKHRVKKHKTHTHFLLHVYIYNVRTPITTRH